MGVATSKVEDQADECLRRMREQGVDVSRPLMVGDRGYDVLSAAAEGIPAIRVLWGCGDPAESARAHATADSPQASARLLSSSGRPQVDLLSRTFS
jgi:phosphoglycolate phosphatase